MESELTDHLNSSIPEHLGLLWQKVDQLDKITGQQQLASPEPSLSSRIQSLETTVTRLSSQAQGGPVSLKGPDSGARSGDGGNGMTRDVAEAVGAVAEKMNVYEGVITVLNREVEKLTVQVSVYFLME